MKSIEVIMVTPEVDQAYPGGRSLSIDEMKAKARNIRRNIVTMIATAGSGHPGGSLFCGRDNDCPLFQGLEA
jgi:hypothetical protein